MIQEASWRDARVAAAQPWNVLPSEKKELSLCADRTVFENIYALVELPTYATSAMDGYAVAGSSPWKIVGEIKAGKPMESVLSDGTAVKIATGGVIPEGTYGVLRWENATVVGEILTGEVAHNQEIRPAGLESEKGALLAPKGTVLNPGLIGLLAAAGHDTIYVVTKPRVKIILLGDEIQLDGIPSNGLVRDALGPQLPAWLHRMGVEVIEIKYVSDELELVVDAIRIALVDSDIVITTGGTADGPRDHVHAAISALGGELVVDRVKVRPGHPMLLASVAGKPLLGLPGNPQSAIVALLSLGQPMINSLLGHVGSALNSVITGDDLDAPDGFTRLVLGNMVDGWFEMGEHLGSAMLRGLANSSGFAVVEKSVEEGEIVAWLPLP
ncbi:unannotated protein [freshwater metagenome]|uniref:Unannotated protein n=1 Tax=freshwater metagenome TaxID=449393 RepID=A0A6J7Y2K7_9ZZZZ|nr:hypothetical protein [Actinomycetota bacterium]